jgi:hypothetical protein
MGGSDQWGNIVTGTELIRRKTGEEAFALTCPLITKTDGSKFGKTEAGNVWLDPEKTTPYQFYQFWLNVSDEDASKYIKIFTVLDRKTIDELISRHNENPQERILQKRLAEEVTVMVHSREDYDAALEASQILFGMGTMETLKKMSERTFLSVFENAPVVELERDILSKDVSIGDAFSSYTKIFESKSELKRLIQQGGFSINKVKIYDPELRVNARMLLNDRYILLQKGKKNFTLIKIKDSFTSPQVLVDDLKEINKVLKKIFSQKDFSESFNSFSNDIKQSFEAIEELWNKQYKKTRLIKYVMLSGAPNWGKNQNYIYNPNSNFTQYFFKQDLEAVLNKTIPNKETFIEELTQMGFMILDLLPLSLEGRVTNISFRTLSPDIKQKLIELTYPNHFSKKQKLIQKKASDSIIYFFRYKYLIDTIKDIREFNYIEKNFELTAISSNMIIDRMKLSSIINKNK